MKSKYKLPSAEIQHLIKSVVDNFDKEDRGVRERQVRMWRRLKLVWEGFQNTWYSEVAHDWRVWDYEQYQDSDQAYYDKPVNVFRAYLESIIAALSVTIPAVKAFPDNADDPLDLDTAKACDKIAELIYRHNDVALLWLHSLFIYCTEGMVAAYSYPDEHEKYGTYESNEYESTDESHQLNICPECGYELSDKIITDQEKDEYDPDEDDVDLHNIIFNEGQEVCPACAKLIDPELRNTNIIVTRLVGKTTQPKGRVCLEAYGGLNVKIPNYSRKQCEVPYLIYAYETHYANAIEMYPHLYNKFDKGSKPSGGVNDPYEQWARLNPQYLGQYPQDTVTIKKVWLRPAAFNILEQDECKKLKKKYPDGALVELVNDTIAHICNENLDDRWTLTYNPMADYLTYDPLGMLLTSVQEITNDLISLTLQTIEHGIPQTFADPSVVNFTQYKQMEVTPGAIVPTKPSTGKNIGEGFYEVKTTQLSGEVLPFGQQVQSLGQLASGALPSLFGGALEGTDTASEYAMSRSQALQRQGNTWKMFTLWWKQIMGKAVPIFMNLVQEDIREVQKNKDGNFFNVFIRKSELEGKLGRIELEANENLPMSWNQKKDLLMQLIQNNNPEVLAIIGAPENLPIIREALGLTDLYIPGEDEVVAEYSEIKQLLNSTPIESTAVDPITGQPIPQELPSVEVDPDFDNHGIRFEIDRKWINSDEGRLAKIENPLGYKNILLHARMHLMFIKQAQQAEMVSQEQSGAPNLKKPNQLENKEAPIEGNSDVQTQS